jgi:hypothetical protein
MMLERIVERSIVATWELMTSSRWLQFPYPAERYGLRFSPRLFRKRNRRDVLKYLKTTRGFMGVLLESGVKSRGNIPEAASHGVSPPEDVPGPIKKHLGMNVTLVLSSSLNHFSASEFPRFCIYLNFLLH